MSGIANDKMSRAKLNPAYLKILRVMASVFTLIPVLPMTGIAIAIDDMQLWMKIGLIAAIWLLLFLLSQKYIKAWYRRYSYWLQAEGLFIQKGVFWRSTTLVPSNRIQHVDIGSGPIDRKYGLSKLTLHTAGTSNAAINLPGLLNEDATHLRQALLDLSENDSV